MKIFNLRLEVDEHVARLRASVESEYFGSKDLWFSLPREHEGALCTTRLDAFLVGLLYPAMYSGEDVHLDGCVSEKLLDNINHYVVPLLQSFSSALKSVAIHAREIVKTRERINAVIAERTGQTLERVAQDTDRDYWMSAEESLAYGLVGRIIRKAADLSN